MGVMFAVDDIGETLEKLRNRGAQLAGEVVQYKDAYPLCYIRGPEGFSLDSPKNLAERNATTMTKRGQCQRRLTQGPLLEWLQPRSAGAASALQKASVRTPV